MDKKNILYHEKVQQGYQANNVMKVIASGLLFAGLFAVENCFYMDKRIYLLAVIAAITILYRHMMPSLLGYRILQAILCAGMLLLLVMNSSGCMNAFLGFVNQWIDAFNYHYTTGLSLYQVGQVGVLGQFTFYLIINVLIAFVINWSSEKNQLIWFAVLGLVIMLVAVHLSLKVPEWAYALYGCGIILTFSSGRIKVRMIPFVLAGIALFVAIGAFVGLHFTGNTRLQSMKQQVLDVTDELRYGKDTLPQGDLTKAVDMVGSDKEETLKLSGKTIHSMHLRGFVGNQFSDNQWTTGTTGKYYQGDQAGMLTWLKSKRFFPMSQLSLYALFSNQGDEMQKVKVENVGAYRKYVYFPYEGLTNTNSEGTPYFDWQMRSGSVFGWKNYNIEVAATNMAQEGATYRTIDSTKTGAADYQSAESVYRTFVKENYVEVDASIRKRIRAKVIKNTQKKSTSFYAITKQIRLALMQLNTYSDTPDAYDGTKDFVTWFLADDKKCNAVHYATIATLAYRSCGYPARYVEGYYLKDTKQNEATLTQRDAHAWVEVYLDGMGWFPVEVAPGYYTAEYTLKEVAPSPDSSVNVVEDNQNTLTGSTTDELKGAENKKRPELKRRTIEKVVYTLGIIIFIWLVILFVLVVIHVQSIIRKTKRKQRLESKYSIANCSMVYRMVSHGMNQRKMKFDYQFPKKNRDFFIDGYETLTAEEYDRFLELILKSRFSVTGLNAAEYETVLHFYERFLKENYRRSNIINKWRMRYVEALL